LNTELLTLEPAQAQFSGPRHVGALHHVQQDPARGISGARRDQRKQDQGAQRGARHLAAKCASIIAPGSSSGKETNKNVVCVTVPTDGERAKLAGAG
jgi:hypothetical protein